VYYPAASNGDNIPVITNGKKFSLLVFGHGYQLTYSDYVWLKDSLVPKGFFLVFPRTEEQLFPSHTDFAKDYAFIIDRFDATKNNNSNWYYNRIKNKYAVGGHSMGGGCSLLSVQYSAKISAVFNFAAAETNPSAIAACNATAIPVLLFAGGKDCISPPSSNQLPMYNNIQNICKTYVLVTAARHCHWANNNGTCRAGELFCSPVSPSPKTTLATTFTLLYPWLNDKLNSNKIAAQKFQQLLASTSGITYKQNCNAANVTDDPAANIMNNNLVKVYPSTAPAGTVLNISLPQLQYKGALQVFNQSGTLMYTRYIQPANNQTQQIASANYKKGIYFIVVTDGSKQYKSSFIIE
jgi:pimeloyl-ACP methyl ester carboxylesterase